MTWLGPPFFANNEVISSCGLALGSSHALWVWRNLGKHLLIFLLGKIIWEAGEYNNAIGEE